MMRVLFSLVKLVEIDFFSSCQIELEVWSFCNVNKTFGKMMNWNLINFREHYFVNPQHKFVYFYVENDVRGHLSPSILRFFLTKDEFWDFLVCFVI